MSISGTGPRTAIAHTSRHALMRLYQLVLKDIIRRKRRVLFAVIGVLIGTMTVVGIFTISRAGEARLYEQLEKYGPNLAVIPAINNVDVNLGALSLGTLSVGENYVSEDTLPQIREIADSEIREVMGIDDEGNIATIAPKLYVNTEVNGIPVMIVGVEPEEEIRIKTWWQVNDGEYFERTDQALVGAVAAELLGIRNGDTIPLNGTSEVTVVGILEETAANDDYQIFVPLQTLQAAFSKEGLVSSVDIRALCNACPVVSIADDINSRIPGIRAIAVKQVANTEMEMMSRINRFMLTLAGITLAVGLFGVGNTMMRSVNERTKDIGIMRAVGASYRQIMKLFIHEAVIIGIVGGIFGYLAGTLLAYGLGPVIFGVSAIRPVLQYFPFALGLAVGVAVVATLYPAFRAARIKVADSFRAL
jgi:putative ABC transport system permease protein